MLFTSYAKYICQFFPAVFLRNKNLSALDVSCLLPHDGLSLVFLFLKYSFFFKKSSLLDIGGLDVPYSHVRSGLVSYNASLWYIFKLSDGSRLVIFSLPTQPGALSYEKAGLQSAEVLFRNARWLEREAAESYGLFFSGKRDRRALFTVPLLYNSPLRKKYPTIGFYEIFFCSFLKKLKFKNLSLQV
jgi:NADH dehydrogenase (ubiquinone) Fe-S protein 3